MRGTGAKNEIVDGNKITDLSWSWGRRMDYLSQRICTQIGPLNLLWFTQNNQWIFTFFPNPKLHMVFQLIRNILIREYLHACVFTFLPAQKNKLLNPLVGHVHESSSFIFWAAYVYTYILSKWKQTKRRRSKQ